MSKDPKKQLDKTREIAEGEEKKLKAIQIVEDIIDTAIQVSKNLSNK